jgi:lipoate-protein ligase A
MATDEFLLLQAVQHRVLSLRFYPWNQPTLTIGYFQPVADREGHAASAPCELIRRTSGGGAIVHDLELTYSLAIPLEARGTGTGIEFYRLAHESLSEALTAWNAKTRQADDDDVCRSNSGAFLCFQRRSVGDLLFDKMKIAGSAQRRFKSALLQHGSVLLGRSHYAPELPGILELTGTSIDRPELANAWVERIRQRTSWWMQPSELDGKLSQNIDEIARNKFGCAKWNSRR